MTGVLDYLIPRSCSLILLSQESFSSACFPEQNRDLLAIGAEQVALGHVNDMGAEVLAHDAVPLVTYCQQNEVRTFSVTVLINLGRGLSLPGQSPPETRTYRIICRMSSSAHRRSSSPLCTVRKSQGS